MSKRSLNDFELKSVLLLSNWSRKVKLVVPKELIHLIVVTFLSWIPTIDIFDEDYFESINFGRQIRATSKISRKWDALNSNNPKYRNCYSKNVYSKDKLLGGKYEFKVKVFGGDTCFRSVGLVTNNKYQISYQTHSANIKQDNNNLSYFLYGDTNAIDLRQFINGQMSVIYRLKNNKWKNGQIIKVIIDLNEGNINFIKGGIKIGDGIKVKKNKEYYIALGMCDGLGNMGFVD